jgi:hypothetical protein
MSWRSVEENHIEFLVMSMTCAAAGIETARRRQAQLQHLRARSADAP